MWLEINNGKQKNLGVLQIRVCTCYKQHLLAMLMASRNILADGNIIVHHKYEMQLLIFTLQYSQFLAFPVR